MRLRFLPAAPMFALMLSLLLVAACSPAVEPFVPTAEKPEALPAFSSLNLYNANSPFNTPIAASATADPNSTSYVQALANSAGSANGLLVQLKQYSAAVYIANAETTPYDVALPCGDHWQLGVNTLTGVPIPEWAEPTWDADGANSPIREGRCGENSDQDNHMIVLDLANRCEYDFWQARRLADGSWEASWGNAISMDSDGIYPAGLSTRGSGFAFLGGVIWPDELQQGEINHALVFSYPLTRSGGPVAPATDSDGTVNQNDALPEGARLRLNPDLDLDALNLTPAERTIAQALQTYGMYLVDNGGDSGVAIYCVDPLSVQGNPYDGLLEDTDYPILGNIPLSELQVLSLGVQDPDYQAKLDLTDTGCNSFQ